MYQDSEWAYLARVHDVLDGHPSLGAPVFYEYKSVPGPLPPMGEYFYAALYYLTHIPINDLIVATKFLFPFILFLCAYAAAYLLGRQGLYPRLSGLAAATAVIFGLDFVNPSYLASIIRAGASVLYLSVWERLVNPITGAMLLFAFISVLILHLRGNRWMWVAMGIMLGLMTGYIFSFAIALVTTGIVCAVLFWQARFSQAREIIYTVVLGGLINTFQIPSIWMAMTSPDAQAFSLRNGLLLTHMPLIDKWLVLVTLVLGAALWRYGRVQRKWGEARDSILIISSLIAATFVVMNQQIITGRTIWPEHFVQYAVPISYVALAVVGGLFVSTFDSLWIRRVWKGILVAGIFVCLAFGAYTAVSYRSVLPDFIDQQRIAPAMQWLDVNTPDDCVVFTVEEPDTERLSDMVPALTHCDVYWSSYVFVGIPEDRIEHNYLMRLRFAGVTALQAPAYIHGNNEEYRSVLFQDWKQMFWYSDDQWLNSIRDNSSIQQYFDTLEIKLASDYDRELKGDFKSQLQQYKIDYVMWDSEKYPEWNPGTFPFLYEVYSSNGIHIYALK